MVGKKWIRKFKKKMKDLFQSAIVIKPDQRDARSATDFVDESVDIVEKIAHQAYDDGVSDTLKVVEKAGVEQGDAHEVVLDGETFRIPFVAFFPPGDGAKAGYHFLEVVGKQPPKKGDNYLSGNLEATRARQDMENDHLVVTRTHMAKKHNVWRKHAETKENKEG